MSPRVEREYVVALARTVDQMFSDGVNDPSAAEVADAHFQNWVLGGEIAEGIRKRLRKIRDILQEEYQYPVCLVGKTYYDIFRGKRPILTAQDAHRCLPLGYSMTAQGLYRPLGKDDPIWQASVTLSASQGAAKVKSAYDRELSALEEGRLSEKHATSMITSTQQQMVPKQEKLFERVLAEHSEGLVALPLPEALPLSK